MPTEHNDAGYDDIEVIVPSNKLVYYDGLYFGGGKHPETVTVVTVAGLGAGPSGADVEVEVETSSGFIMALHVAKVVKVKAGVPNPVCYGLRR